MATGKRTLGRGLSALMSDSYSTFSDALEAQVPGIAEIPLDMIQAGSYQPRTRFDEHALAELADSIRKNGVMQPILLRERDDAPGQYEIVAGERRWRAARALGLPSIPGIVRALTRQQALEIALIENIQRQDLSPLEEAVAYQRLIQEFQYTQEELAQSVGKSRSHITNLLRLLTLPESLKQHLAEERISMGHAKALINVPGAERIADLIIERGLNVRQTEMLVRRSLRGDEQPAPRTPRAPRSGQSAGRAASAAGKDEDIMHLEHTLTESLGMPVAIDHQDGQGVVAISYASLEQLDGLLRRLSDV